MNQPQNQESGGEDSGAGKEPLYAGALRRIRRVMGILGIAAPIIVGLALGWRMAMGVALGCGIAYVNFRWLVRGVERMTERMTGGGETTSGSGIVSRFLMRYVLMGVAAYVILNVSPMSLYGLLAGLFLPVAAIAWEAAYELYAALRRDI